MLAEKLEKLLSFNFQSRKQILTLRGVYKLKKLQINEKFSFSYNSDYSRAPAV